MIILEKRVFKIIIFFRNKNKTYLMKSDWKPEKFNYKFTNFQSPYHKKAPWPSMRGDIRNSGTLMNCKYTYKEGGTQKVIHFQTGNSIFSTPIIGPNEKIYVGSADHKFYLLEPHEERKAWEYDIGEIIDSAGCIDKEGNVYVAGGDGKIHAYSAEGKEKWQYDAVNNRPKELLSFSTNFWFEANIVLGPDGAIYVANDDFYLYKMTKEGDIIWAYRTGFLIWSAPAFWKDGTVFIAGFDQILYALDMDTGKLKWKTDLNGSLVSSTTVGIEGTLYQGSFNGNMYGIDSQDGNIKWKFSTGAHIYASAAVSPDNIIYFGSTNGMFYALNGENGELKWSYYIGDAIRASASLGPDPEGIYEYLVYFGGGNGFIYAMDPNGKLRWAYDTLVKALNDDYPNINASIALGYTGLAVASATGDVIWVPYDYYMKENAEGIYLNDIHQTDLQDLKWHNVTQGGKMEKKPITQTFEVLSTNNLNIRLLKHQNNRIKPVLIDYQSIKITIDPQINFEFQLQSDLCTINIIPNEIMQPSTQFIANIELEYKDHADNQDEEESKSFESKLTFKTVPSSKNTTIMNTDYNRYKIVRMALPQPNIVPSLNQIGFASLTIPFVILDKDEKNNKYLAWAVQRFGDIGVPLKRISFYAFNGKIEGQFFMMDAHNCLFEITSFNIPLDILRVSGKIQPDGSVAKGSSLLIDKKVGQSVIPLLRDMGTSSPITPRMMLTYLKKGGFIRFLKASSQFIRALIRQVRRNVWKDWGLINPAGHLLGLGTYKLAPYTEYNSIQKDQLKLLKFENDEKKKYVTAEILYPKQDSGWNIIVGILLVERETLKILPINYTNAIQLKYRTHNNHNDKNNENFIHIKAKLKVPKEVRKNNISIRAYLVVELDLVQVIDF
ncbi:MAG: PQQ-binding-like beta-propeller repeat protein [Candidatus Lokiarchaeota archaeon]|nr:PQQ-binding-like beta-propeller repeat protein [Candidatus Lokiarchaeota archaeon]